MQVSCAGPGPLLTLPSLPTLPTLIFPPTPSHHPRSAPSPSLPHPPLAVAQAQERLQVQAASLAVRVGQLDAAELIVKPLLERYDFGTNKPPEQRGAGAAAAALLPLLKTSALLHVAQVCAYYMWRVWTLCGGW